LSLSDGRDVGSVVSDREVEVLRFVARGKSNREIGDLLGISPRTLQNHVAYIYDMIGVTAVPAPPFSSPSKLCSTDFPRCSGEQGAQEIPPSHDTDRSARCIEDG